MLRKLVQTMATSPKRVPIPKNGVDYRGKVVLAPMVRSGELPSRILALKYDADLVWGKHGLVLLICFLLINVQNRSRDD